MDPAAVFISGPETEVDMANASINSTMADASLDSSIAASSISISPTLVFSTITLGFIIYRLLGWATSELPPRGSGLKAIPGPRSTVPYLGRIHDVNVNSVWRDMLRFNSIYKGLFSLTLGGETHIWVGREDIAQDLLCKNGAICSSRADLGAYPDVTKEYRYLPLMGYNDHLVKQRKFAHQVVSKNVNTNFKGYITLEAKRYLHELLSNPDPTAWFGLIELFCGRVTSRCAYGTDENAAFHVHNASTFIHSLGPSGPVTNLIPFLKNLPEWLIPAKRPVRLRQEAEAKVWRESFYKTKARIESGRAEPSSYVSAYLENIAQAEPGKQLLDTEKEAINTVGMLCTVAIITIAGPAQLFVMAMILHPEWQEKVRIEVEKVVGQDGFVDLEHGPRLPLLRAAIKECLRWKSTVPLGVPRLLDTDYSYEGYHFPKHAVVHVLDVALASNAELYPDHEIYNPSRWLDPKFPTYQGPEGPKIRGSHIFGRGRRGCPGPDMVEAELVVLCGNLVKLFELRPQLVDGKPVLPDPDDWSTDVIGGPNAFACDIRIRDEHKRESIEKMYQQAFA